MDGKPTIKIMSKTQLLGTMRLTNPDQNKVKAVKKLSTRKRGSTPLISTSISVQRKNNNQPPTIRKLHTNNFMTSNNNIFNIINGKRLSQCQTAMGIRHVKRDDPVQKTEAQKILLKNSDKLYKMLWNEIADNLFPLILSSDFIMDQDCFWSTPKIQTSVIKSWKDLHKFYYVIWIVKSQKGFKRLKDFSQAYQLPLNAVYYHRRQSMYTIDFTIIRKQLSKVYGSSLTQIIAIQCLKINSKHTYEAKSFLGRVPLMFDHRLRVCYLRAEESGQGLDKILQVCRTVSEIKDQNERLILLKSIPIFIEDHLRHLEQQKSAIEHKLRAATIFDRYETQYVDEQLVQQQVENLKRELIEQVIKQKGRNFQHEGFSAHYLVGDIIKRNYDMLYRNAMLRCKGRQRWKQQQRQQQRQKRETVRRQLNLSQQFYQYYI